MQDLTPASIQLPATSEDDPRVGHLLGTDAERARVVIVGFPSDEGVRRNGGRPGASEGPDAIRSQLYKLTPDARHWEAFTSVLQGTVDIGNVRVSGDLESDQERLGAVLAPYLRRGAIPIVLGGGHETSYGHFLGYVGAGLDVRIVNVDAHPDVRPLKNGLGHSGSPFRQALMHPSGRCTEYAVAGLQPHSTSHVHLDWLARQGGQYTFRDETESAFPLSWYNLGQTSIMATIDLDAVDASQAPGVSAPSVRGLSAETWCSAAYHAGTSPLVTSMDIVELSPHLDSSGNTARLAALTVWFFLKGIAEREYQ